MNIIAHRGFWLKPEEKNTIEAFIKAFDSGHGVETDIRDDRGKLVISHDMPNGSELLFDDFLALLKGRNLPLAINIKSDGIINPLKDSLERFNIQNYFTFDMSFPESRKYIKNNLHPLLGLSEFHSLFFDQTEYAGIWLDSFERDWFNEELILRWLNKLQDKPICIVSPELHNRDHLPLWKMLKDANLHHKKAIAICTDYPDQADQFFNERSI